MEWDDPIQLEWNDHSIPDEMEYSFHSGWNGMTPFQSNGNGMSSPFQPE